MRGHSEKLSRFKVLNEFMRDKVHNLITIHTFRFASSAAYFSAFFTMFSISSLDKPPDDWITTEI